MATHANDDRADRFIGRIVAFCQALETFPQRGTRRDDLLLGLRTIGFERRVTIAFLAVDPIVIIEGVHYGGRNLDAMYASIEDR